MSGDNSYSNASSENWFSRLMGSFKTVLLGFILFTGAFFLIWWNEGRAIKTTIGLEQGLNETVNANLNKIEPNNDGKLVHLSGEVSSEELLTDHDFKFSVKAIKLKRSVEMFQWVEKKEVKKNKKVGGSEETKTTYTYEKEWKNSLIDSDEFEKRKKHNNPKVIPFNEYNIKSRKVNIGVYQLSPTLITGVNHYEAYENIKLDSLKYENAKLIYDKNNSPTIYLGDGDINKPKIGDIIVSFDIVPVNKTYSIIAQQQKESFCPFKTASGTTIEIISKGIHSSEEMFGAEHSSNNIMTWLYRFASLLMLYFGIKNIFNPLVVLAEIIPFLGKLLDMGISLFAGVLAFILAFITIAIAWIVHRPIVGASLVLIALIIGIVFYIKASKKRKKLSNQ